MNGNAYPSALTQNNSKIAPTFKLNTESISEIDTYNLAIKLLFVIFYQSMSPLLAITYR
jgi:hypothetical protein